MQVLTDSERAEGALQWAMTNMRQGEVVYTTTEIRQHWQGFGPLAPEDVKPIGAPIRQQITDKGTVPSPDDGTSIKAAEAYDEFVDILQQAIKSGNRKVVEKILWP
jgi:hypothetical protein